MVCCSVPKLIKEKNRVMNKWAMSTEDNYAEVLKNEKTAVAFYKDLLSYKFPIKELKESFDFVYRVRSLIRSKKAIELFCGHGLIGQILVRFHLVNQVWQYDKIWSTNRALVYNLFDKTKVYPIEEKVESNLANENNAGLVYSMHGCGGLTDMTIDFAIKNNIDVMVCPCCYQLAKQPHEVFKSHEMDRFRIAKLLLNDYDIHLKTIHESISPMNRIIIGLKKRAS